MPKRLVANEKELNRFWTGIMRNEAEEIKIRLKASENLARILPEQKGGMPASLPEPGAAEEVPDDGREMAAFMRELTVADLQAVLQGRLERDHHGAN